MTINDDELRRGISMKYVPVSGRELPRFAGIKTFFRLPYVPMKSDYDVALVGVPFDGSQSFRPGSRFAPGRVREVSSLGRVYHWERQLSFIDNLKVADIGDIPIVPIDVAKSYKIIEDYYAELLKLKKKFVAVGGDHSTTLPTLRALRKKYKKPIAVVHFDAHLDTYPAAWDCEYHHGSFMRHAVEEDLVNPKKVFQIGLRGPLAGKDDLDFIAKHQFQIYTVQDIRSAPIDSITKKINKMVGDDLVYITYDIDCLDPAYAPGTGTPVIGGLTTYETQQILRGLRLPGMVGGDVVEVSPPYDHADITSLAAVDAMFEMINILSQAKK
jgi:agmatinase/guanidinopropionase